MRRDFERVRERAVVPPALAQRPTAAEKPGSPESRRAAGRDATSGRAQSSEKPSPKPQPNDDKLQADRPQATVRRLPFEPPADPVGVWWRRIAPIAACLVALAGGWWLGATDPLGIASPPARRASDELAQAREALTAEQQRALKLSGELAGIWRVLNSQTAVLADQAALNQELTDLRQRVNLAEGQLETYQELLTQERSANRAAEEQRLAARRDGPPDRSRNGMRPAAAIPPPQPPAPAVPAAARPTASEKTPETAKPPVVADQKPAATATALPAASAPKSPDSPPSPAPAVPAAVRPSASEKPPETAKPAVVPDEKPTSVVAALAASAPKLPDPPPSPAAQPIATEKTPEAVKPAVMADQKLAAVVVPPLAASAPKSPDPAPSPALAIPAAPRPIASERTPEAVKPAVVADEKPVATVAVAPAVSAAALAMPAAVVPITNEKASTNAKPAAVADEKSTKVAAPTPSLPAALDLARLMARASLLLGQGDIGAARSVLERAAEEGSMSALFALAETYDPAVLSAWGTVGTRGDVAKAKDLYAKAFAGGFLEAKDRLNALH